MMREVDFIEPKFWHNRDFVRATKLSAWMLIFMAFFTYYAFHDVEWTENATEDVLASYSISQRQRIIPSGQIDHIAGFSYTTVDPGKEFRFVPHEGSTIEVMHVLDGHGVMHMVGSHEKTTTFKLSPGVTIVVESEEKGSIFCDGPGELRYVFFGVLK